ncbi:phosphatidate phosphatase LPIN3 isoform X2 [Octopus bimaculoides]|uniref:phosphatidate phosphatase LPIN3 isoform X2 n=1 Tax=Octopus bimaculoides TaxID=37653 RepID=UPI00071D208A|nr:phosphatidate phosphatase LPIN3 isoform X2 [Octopus bimaculoides]|eukprot:XP_014767628.1 PREDICTED: phosphatidate phosphatase LPIN3-like [Octopus bimaculoides]
MSRLLNKIFGFYKDINPATLTGSIDVIIIQHEDDTYSCSPFHVRFGKIGVLHAREKVVDITINGKPSDLHMKLGEAGEAFFVQEVDEPTEFPPYLATSPIQSNGAELMEQGLKTLLQSSERQTDQDSHNLTDISVSPLGQTSTTSGPESSPEGGTSESEGHGLTRKRKKRKNMRRKTVTKSANVDKKLRREEDIFEMEDVSTDEDCLGLNQSLKDITIEDKMNRTDNWASMQYQFSHPFSDSEALVHVEPHEENIKETKSDTEMERSSTEVLSGDEPTWEWGDLPKLSESGGTASPGANTITADAKRGEEAAGGIFGFMSSKPKSQTSDKPEGIYLDEINKLDDPEIAKYFPKSHFESMKDKEEDNESGRGPSLPQSPHSVEGAIGGPSLPQSPHSVEGAIGASAVNFFESEVKHLGDVSLSLCGGLTEPDGVTLEKFMQKVLTYDDLCESPSLINNPDLIIKIHDQFYNWQTAAPVILSMISFQKNLPSATVESLAKDYMPKKVDKKKSIGSGVSSWFKWGRGTTVPITSPPPPPPPPLLQIPTGVSTSGTDFISTHSTYVTAAMTSSSSTTTTSSVATKSSLLNTPLQSTSPIPSPPSSIKMTNSEEDLQEKNIIKTEVTNETRIHIHSDNKDEIISTGTDTDISEQECLRTDSNSPHPQPTNSLTVQHTITNTSTNDTQSPTDKKKDRFKKSLRLTSEEISKLGLHEGSNEVTFSVTTQYQGTCRCTSHIYLWKSHEKIIISDIDGTITKSDVLGHIFPILGLEWSQSGVAELFTRINNNSYKFVYLSARAIGQSRGTKELLKSIKQGGLELPDGPLLLNPTSLISALHREVVNKNPQEFKISCLKDIAALFPSNPFYAGFGNKITDVYAYKALNIPDSHIFTINPQGHLRHELIQTFNSTYSRLSDIADHFFPPLYPKEMGNRGRDDQETSSEFSNPIFWRQPLPDISGEVKILLETTSKDVKTKTKDSKQKR